MNTIFLDELFLLNLSLDYLALLCTAVLAGGKIRRARLLFAAVFGGLYAIFGVFPGCSWLLSWPVKLSAAIGICLLAFWDAHHLGVCCLVFLTLSAAFGGLLTALGAENLNGFYIPIDIPALLLTFFLSYFLLSTCYAYLPKAHKQEYSPVTVTHSGRTVQFSALHDSGNELTDPLTGLPVLICEPEILRALLPDLPEDLSPADPILLVETATAPRMHLICCATVTGTALLAGFQPDSVLIDGKIRPHCLAASATSFSRSSPYSAIY